MLLLLFLYYLHCFPDSDDKSSFGIIFEVELVYEVGYELKKPTPTLSEVSCKSDRLFGFLELFHLTACFWFESTPSITDFHVDSQNLVLSLEVYRKVILVERKASILDGVIHEFIRYEHKTIFPGHFYAVFLEQEENKITDDFRLIIVGLKNQFQVKVSKIGDVIIRKIDEFVIFQIGNIYL